tara:strand:+ start:182 stop:388 length:207 start_codon:yes stop_codon:yes gene_type:complete
MPTIYTKPCIHCNKISTIDAETQQQYDDYIAGIKLVQNIYPEKSVDERELLISGIHPKCWEEMYPENN